MGILKPAVVAAMLVAAPGAAGAAGAQESTQPTVEVTRANLINACRVPRMTVDQLDDYAASLGTSLGQAVNVTSAELVAAQAVASEKLGKGKGELTVRVTKVEGDLEKLKKEMEGKAGELYTDTLASAFSDGGALQEQLKAWKELLATAKKELDTVESKVPLLVASVRVDEQGLRLNDVRGAFTKWENASGIQCPDNVKTYVATDRVFSDGSIQTGDVMTRRVRAMNNDGIGGLGTRGQETTGPGGYQSSGFDGSGLSGGSREEPKEPSNQLLLDYLVKVDGLQATLGDLLGEVETLKNQIAQLKVEQGGAQ